MSEPVVIIGSGVNELVCAHRLARAGRRVLVIAAREPRDGSLLEPGWIPPAIVRDFSLDRHGLTIHRPDPWATVALPGGGALELSSDMERSVTAIRRLSPRDAERWPAFCERMARLARLLEAVYAAAPPDPLGRAPRDVLQLAAIALRARRLGRQGVEDLLRLLPISAADLLDDWFETDALKGALGAAGILHLARGPRSGGTAFNLLHHHVGSPPGVFRPPRSNVRHVLAGLPGIELRRGAEVARIGVRDGRATSVVLASGEEIAAAHVASGADPLRTLTVLADPKWLDPDLARALRHVRSRGVVARVSLMLERPAGPRALVVAPSLDDLEHAYDDAKYGRVSQHPYLEAVSAADGAAGSGRVDVHVQCAPYALAQGAWDDGRRLELGNLTVKMLSRHFPDFEAAVVTRVLSPRELEVEYGWPEGQACHAELALDQALWMRPVPALARYRTPIRGLYLCGAGMHPGAGVAGAAGAHAAQEILRDGDRT
ncbi:MAG: NAD(P)/FAD-dependent oxidoreductase [Betaproteobacteria bacterium]|nr:NAD(P)/FAD-dependent oxidoreductase [Betaproteobacteria bacterium]